MANSGGRFDWVIKLSRIGLIGIIVLLAVSLVAAIATLAMHLADLQSWEELIGPILAIVGLLAALIWSFVLYGIIQAIIANEYACVSAAGRLSRVETLIGDQLKNTKKLVDLESLSDRAKSLVFREQELDALREAVHHDMMKQDYASAEKLIENLESELGYVEEASRLRGELDESRRSTNDEKIDNAISRIQKIIDAREWTRAIREASRVVKLFPDNPKVQALPSRIEAARDKTKRDLLQAYDEAVRKKDIDRGIELLKELDAYLTPQEGAALEDSARGVFRAKLHNLGVQFALRVTEKNWAGAVAVGEQIMRNYPNTRMAHEVQSKIDLLRTRANAENPTAELES